jgi:hypothetical protein
MIYLKFKSRDEFNDYFFGPYAEKEIIFDEIVDEIEGAMLNKQKLATFAEVEINLDGEDEDLYIFLDLPKKNWEESLLNALKYYETQELFEKCSRVSNMLKKIAKK